LPADLDASAGGGGGGGGDTEDGDAAEGYFSPPTKGQSPAMNWTNNRGAIHQLLNIIIQLRILVLLVVSTLPYVVKVNNYY
jgi:hypothetical protein